MSTGTILISVGNRGIPGQVTLTAIQVWNLSLRSLRFSPIVHRAGEYESPRFQEAILRRFEVPCLTNGFNQTVYSVIHNLGASASRGNGFVQSTSHLSSRFDLWGIGANSHHCLGLFAGNTGKKSGDFVEISATSCVLRSRRCKACVR